VAKSKRIRAQLLRDAPSYYSKQMFTGWMPTIIIEALKIV